MSGPTPYNGGETTGFMSPAQDHIETVIDLGDVLDLRRPNRYLVRVKGNGLSKAGVLDGDLLVTDTTGRPSGGRIVVVFSAGEVVLARVEPKPGGWFLRFSEPGSESEDAEIWAVATALVRAVL